MFHSVVLYSSCVVLLLMLYAGFLPWYNCYPNPRWYRAAQPQPHGVTAKVVPTTVTTAVLLKFCPPLPQKTAVKPRQHSRPNPHVASSLIPTQFRGKTRKSWDLHLQNLYTDPVPRDRTENQDFTQTFRDETMGTSRDRDFSVSSLTYKLVHAGISCSVSQSQVCLFRSAMQRALFIIKLYHYTAWSKISASQINTILKHSELHYEPRSNYILHFWSKRSNGSHIWTTTNYPDDIMK